MLEAPSSLRSGLMDQREEGSWSDLSISNSSSIFLGCDGRGLFYIRDARSFCGGSTEAPGAGREG